jgi:hypothetical protein
MPIWEGLDAFSANHQLPRSTEIRWQIFCESPAKLRRNMSTWIHSVPKGTFVCRMFLNTKRGYLLLCKL